MTRSVARGLLVTMLAIPVIALGTYGIVDGRAASTETSGLQQEAASTETSGLQQEVVQEETPTCEGSPDEPSMTLAAQSFEGLEEAAPDDTLGPRSGGYCRADCWPCNNNADCAGHGSVCYPVCP